jgi:uncharacterized protein (TIGR03067 family)
VKKKRILFVLAVSLLLLVSAKLMALAFHAANPHTAKEGVASVDGTWRVIAGERNGEAVDILKDIQFKDARFIIKGNKITLKAPTMEQPGKLKLDPSKNPKAIEIVLNAGTDAERVFPGVYAVEGDKLKICLGTDSKARPSEFRTQPGEHLVLFILQREKP